MKKLIIIIIIFITAYFQQVYSDIIVSLDNSIIVGKVTFILYNIKENSPKFFKIKNEIGIFNINNDNIKSYWLTNGPEEDINILKMLGDNKYIDEILERIKDADYYKEQRIEEYENKEEDSADDIIDKSILKNKEIIKWDIQKRLFAAGIGFTITGACLIAAGLPLLIYDTVYYRNIVIDKYKKNHLTFAGYQDYLNSYYIYTGLLSGSITSAAIGIVLLAVGIPFTVYYKLELLKAKGMSFNILISNSLAFYLSYKI
jgi:hypothetical protein